MKRLNPDSTYNKGCFCSPSDIRNTWYPVPDEVKDNITGVYLNHDNKVEWIIWNNKIIGFVFNRL